MRILVTNDDSINAPGLWAVVESLTELGQVSVVAPDRDQSGIGTARTLLNVLRVSEVETRVPGVPAYTVSGTPSDCVILATSALFDEPFDLVVSGINEGANLGLDVLDSGTAGGAFRGYFRGIPSIAVSVTAVTGVKYDTAARVASSLVESLDGDRSPLVYNVNVPNVPQDRLRGVKETFLGPKAWLEGVERGYDGRRTLTTGSTTASPRMPTSPRAATSGRLATTGYRSPPLIWALWRATVLESWRDSRRA